MIYLFETKEDSKKKEILVTKMTFTRIILKINCLHNKHNC